MQATIRSALAGLVLATLATDLRADPGAALPINSVPAILTNPGTYYLTGDFGIGAGNAIEVMTTDVVIDLCGHSITNTSGAVVAVSGAGVSRVTVKNGSLDGFASAITLGTAAVVEDVEVRNCQLGISVADESRVERCRAVANSSTAISAGLLSTVRDCTLDISTDSPIGISLSEKCVGERIAVRGGAVGIFTGRRARLDRCSVSAFDKNGISLGDSGIARECNADSGHTGATGITLSFNASARACTVDNGSAGIVCLGLNLVDECVVFDCTDGIVAQGRVRITDCMVASSLATGIRATGPGVSVADSTIVTSKVSGVSFEDPGGSIERCQVSDNHGDGIVLADACVASWNVVSGNEGTGVRCAGNRGRVQGNTLDGNQLGLVADGKYNLLTGNRATNNAGGDFQVVPKNPLGPLVGTSSWLPGSIPQANFVTPLF